MFYRVFAVGIVGFWLLMGTILVRDEWFPDRDRRQPVPVDYVGHLVFRHEQASDLLLFAQKRRQDGSIHVQPKRLTPPASGNLLSLSGNFLLTLPGTTGQRAVFHGALELDDHGAVQRVELSVSLHEPTPGPHEPRPRPPGVTLHLDGRVADNQWHYQVTEGTVTLSENSGTPAEILQKLDLGAYGIDARTFAHLGAGAATAAPTLSAYRGTLRINEEDIEAFVVTIHQGEGLETAVYVNPLGQILAVKTFLGYDLYDETLAP